MRWTPGPSTLGLCPPPRTAAELAAQQLVLDLSFNSAHFDPETGAVTYENGTYVIQVGVTVVGSEAEDRSDRVDVELENDDGVLVAVSGLGDGATNSATGQMWYGGSAAMIEITARPVLYSGGSASSVGIGVFCGAEADRATEDPFKFTPTCKGTSDADGEDPQFTIATADVVTLNGDDIFPLYLDFDGPSAPMFIPNVNDREHGWINDGVELTGEYDKDDNKDGWLTYGAAGGGVGGYIARLSVAEGDLDEARAADASSAPTLPDPSGANDYCFIASAVDRLGNESSLPKAEKDGGVCMSTADYDAAVLKYNEDLATVLGMPEVSDDA